MSELGSIEALEGPFEELEELRLDYYNRRELLPLFKTRMEKQRKEETDEEVLEEYEDLFDEIRALASELLV